MTDHQSASRIVWLYWVVPFYPNFIVFFIFFPSKLSFLFLSFGKKFHVRRKSDILDKSSHVVKKAVWFLGGGNFCGLRKCTMLKAINNQNRYVLQTRSLSIKLKSDRSFWYLSLGDTQSILDELHVKCKAHHCGQCRGQCHRGHGLQCYARDRLHSAIESFIRRSSVFGVLHVLRVGPYRGHGLQCYAK